MSQTVRAKADTTTWRAASTLLRGYCCINLVANVKTPDARGNVFDDARRVHARNERERVRTDRPGPTRGPFTHASELEN
jgi:hypothetical protein